MTDVSTSEVARRTNGYSFEDLKTLAHVAVEAAARQEAAGNRQAMPNRQVLSSHLDSGFGFMQRLMDDAIGAPKIPSVKWYVLLSLSIRGPSKKNVGG